MTTQRKQYTRTRSKTKVVNRQPKKKAAAAATPLWNEEEDELTDPKIVLADSKEYRQVPGITPHPLVSNNNREKQLDKMFYDLPDFPVEREYEKRAATANMGVILGTKSQTHLIVVIGTLCKDSGKYKKGQSWVIDGHTRRHYWDLSGTMPSELNIVEHVCDNYDELKDIYYQYNSNDSVEKAEEQIRAIIEDEKLTHPITARAWINGNIQSKGCMAGKLKTLFDNVCSNYDGYVSKEGVRKNDDCDYASSGKATPINNRSRMIVRTDIFRKQLLATSNELMILDTYIGGLEKQKRPNLKAKKGQAKFKYGPEGMYLYDGILKAAIMIITKHFGEGQIPKNIVDAFETYINVINGPVYIKHSATDKADYEYNINRAIRDATKIDKNIDIDDPIQSVHRKKGWRESSDLRESRIAVVDTVWNLYCIAVEGPKAKYGSFSETDELLDWYEDTILDLPPKN